MNLRTFHVTILALLSVLILTSSQAEAGFAFRLEKEVPQSAVKGVNPITVNLFDSKTAAAPVATQNFSVGELMVSLLETLSGAPQYRVRMDFTETDALTMGMDLYWEFSLGGSVMGKREKVPQSAMALFAAESGTAVTVTGTVAAANIDQTIARDSEVVNIVNTSSQFYSAAEVDAMLASYRQVVRRNILTAGAELIETDNAFDATSPQVAVDASGNAIAVWQQRAGSLTINIWANRYTAGTGWGTAVLIESFDTGNAALPQLAVSPSGDAVVVWEQWTGSRYDVASNRYTAGTGWGTAEMLGTTNPGGQEQHPQVGVDSSGNAVAVWMEDDGALQNIWASRYIVGSGWGTAEMIETDSAGDAWFPELAVDVSGNAVAVWWQFDGTRDNIWANRYTAGTGWGTAVLIETDNGHPRNPHVSVDVSGNAIAVWQQHDGTRDNIWTNRYTAGTGWGAAAQIDRSTATATDPQVAVDPSGNAVAVWEQSGGTADNIWANIYTFGTGWGAAVQIQRDIAIGASFPKVVVDSLGNAVAVWNEAAAGKSSISASRYTTSTGWGPAGLIETDNYSTANQQQVAVDPAGNAIAVWVQYENNQGSIRGSIRATNF